MPYSPVLIDSASNDNLGSYLMGPNAYGQAQQEAPIVYQNQLYVVLYRSTIPPQPNDFSINVFKSTDQGKTWTVLNPAGAPVRGSAQATGGCRFDGAHTITVAYTDGDILVDGTIHLADFNLLTGLWGAPYGNAGSPTVRLVDQIFLRADGSLLALFNTTFAAGRVQGLSAAVFAAGAWGAPFQVDAPNLTAGRVSDSRAAATLDPVTQTLHVFTKTQDTATFLHHYWFYQQILSTNALGAFANFAENTPPTVPSGDSNPILVGNQIIMGVQNPAGTFATLLVGTPLAAPVFTIMPDPGIDPGTPFSLIGYGPVLAYDGGKTIYAVVPVYDNSFPVGTPFYMQLRLVQTTNLANPAAGPWTETTIFDTRTGPPSFYFPNQIWNNGNVALSGGQLFLTWEAALDNTVNQDTTFWFGIFVPPQLAGMTGGSTGARFKPCLRQGSEWMLSQMAEKLRESRAQKSGWPYRHLFPASVDLEVNNIADIVAPAQDGNLHIILQYTVPSGFRFWMDAILLDGPIPFLPGDAIFVVDENAQVAASSQASRIQGLVNIPTPLGSIGDGEVWQFNTPYEFEPLTVIRCKVMNVNFVPGLPNYFTAGLFGFQVPLVKGE